MTLSGHLAVTILHLEDQELRDMILLLREHLMQRRLMRQSGISGDALLERRRELARDLSDSLGRYLYVSPADRKSARAATRPAVEP